MLNKEVKRIYNCRSLSVKLIYSTTTPDKNLIFLKVLNTIQNYITHFKSCQQTFITCVVNQ